MGSAGELGEGVREGSRLEPRTLHSPAHHTQRATQTISNPKRGRPKSGDAGSEKGPTHSPLWYPSPAWHPGQQAAKVPATASSFQARDLAQQGPGRSWVWEPRPSGRGWQDLTRHRAGHASPTSLPVQALWDRKAFCSLVKGDVWNRGDSGPPHTSLGAAGLALGLGAPRTRHPGPAAGPTALTAGPARPCPEDLQALVTPIAAEHPRPGVWALFCTAPGLARPPLMRPVPYLPGSPADS